MDLKIYFEKKLIENNNYVMEVFIDFFNKRLRLDEYRGNLASIIKKLNEIATANSFTKIIAKVRTEHLSLYFENGFVLEGIIKGYFNGSDAFVLSKFNDCERRNSMMWIKEDEILKDVYELENVKEKNEIKDYLIKKATKKDAKELAILYKNVFHIYPTPLHQWEYIENVMDEGTIFYIIEKDGQVVSAASAEINRQYHNAELTDCATLPQYRKYGFMKILLKKLEDELRSQTIYTAYTIARSLSFGMNAVFRQLGYQYTGRLANNCYIFDKIEDMNIWVKDLSYF